MIIHLLLKWFCYFFLDNGWPKKNTRSWTCTHHTCEMKLFHYSSHSFGPIERSHTQLHVAWEPTDNSEETKKTKKKINEKLCLHERQTHMCGTLISFQFILFYSMTFQCADMPLSFSQHSQHTNISIRVFLFFLSLFVCPVGASLFCLFCSASCGIWSFFSSHILN